MLGSQGLSDRYQLKPVFPLHHKICSEYDKITNFSYRWRILILDCASTKAQYQVTHLLPTRAFTTDLK